ncbi:type II toxin-antitoxin system VapB family antitoxin [Acidithiobacillus thiooxidans]|uniref:type II toxin-antitoxin system VapB family antitoxin n=1 Tax=Acidithiobacillus thiooxidans TaxID=930 RepID=UPI003561D474
MEQATIFRINRSQAVRLPKSIAFPNDVKRVDVVALGRVRILVPAGESWESWFNGEGVSADFMESREQPDNQHRFHPEEAVRGSRGLFQKLTDNNKHSRPLTEEIIAERRLAAKYE